MKSKDSNEQKYIDKLKIEQEIQKQLEEQRIKNNQMKEDMNKAMR